MKKLTRVKKQSFDLANLRTFEVTYKVPADWLEGIKQYVMEQGQAMKPELDALDDTTILIRVKSVAKHEQELSQGLDSKLQFDENYMTATYGPYDIGGFLDEDHLLEASWLS